MTSTTALAKYSSMRTIPSIPIFCVISTALVLHGVIMVARGPIKLPETAVLSMTGASPKSHCNFILFSSEIVEEHSTTKTFCVGSPKNSSIACGLKHKNTPFL